MTKKQQKAAKVIITKKRRNETKSTGRQTKRNDNENEVQLQRQHHLKHRGLSMCRIEACNFLR